MADAIVSVVLKQLISIPAKQVEQEVWLVTGVEKEIEKLTSNFQAIQAVLLDADQRQVKEKAVRVWLDKLRDASYDLDDVLDEWNTVILKSQIKGAEAALVSKEKVWSVFSSPTSYFKQVGLRRGIALKIKEVNQKLDFIVKEKDMYNLVPVRNIDESQRSKTTCFVDVSEIRGRDKEKNDLVSKLLSDGSEKGKRFHVISIVGMGGIGKTTLAQLAYNNEDVKNHFQKRIWVCVSDTFDEIRIAKVIIKGLTNEDCNFVELQPLLEHIHETMAKSKFLLVLDDVWIEEYNWGPLYWCLNNGLRGSKILITTRKETVARMMKSSDIVKLGEFTEEESWSVFRQLAFSNRPEWECKKLEQIGRDIVGKCKGLPLAVKIVGSLLRFKKTEQQWQRILDNDLWNLEEIEKGIFPPLLLSYNDLPSREKRCFSYCAIFPKDYGMNKNELIQLWMAQGYLGLEQNEEMEIIGQDCFDNLVMHSFFQEFRVDILGYNLKTEWKMHDIVHDFAQFLVKSECFSMEINSSNAQSLNSSYVKARHLMLILNNSQASVSLNNISGSQKLRSLFIRSQHGNGLQMQSELLLPDVFEKLTCLRAMELSGIPNNMLPKVGNFLHLRYLTIDIPQIKELPETLCDLYNLQTLHLQRCSHLENLPQGMGKLVNLRHLINDCCNSLSYMPKGIEILTRLRSLSEFVVGGDHHGIEVCTLGSLQNLNHLGGELLLKGLGNVADSGEAKRAQLKNKRNLITLVMFFNGGNGRDVSHSEKDAAVLEALQPPLNLETLLIQDYIGTSFPQWMMSLTQLKHLAFSNCISEHLPPLGRLPSLEHLCIDTMKSLKRVGNEFLGIGNADKSSFIAFPKLKVLYFSGLDDWEDWDDEITREMTIMPSLSSLSILSCPQLKALPQFILLATLDKEIDDCPKLKVAAERRGFGRRGKVVQMVLRLMSLVGSVLAMSFMSTASESGVVSVYGFQLPVSSKWANSSAFEYLVGISAVAAAYSLLQLLVTGSRLLRNTPVIPSRTQAWIVLVADQIFAYAMVSAGITASGITNLNRTGIKHTPLPDFFKALSTFRDHIAISIAFAFFSFVLFAASSLQTLTWLSKS